MPGPVPARDEMGRDMNKEYVHPCPVSRHQEIPKNVGKHGGHTEIGLDQSDSHRSVLRPSHLYSVLYTSGGNGGHCQNPGAATASNVPAYLCTESMRLNGKEEAMASFYRAVFVLSFLAIVDPHMILADEVLPNVGGAGGPGAVCFGGNFVVVGPPNPSARCEGGKVMHPEVANYLLLKNINHDLASSLASQERFQRDMLAKLQQLSGALRRQGDASESGLRQTIVRKFDSLPRELRTSEPIVTLRKQILDEVEKHMQDHAEARP